MWFALRFFSREHQSKSPSPVDLEDSNQDHGHNSVPSEVFQYNMEISSVGSHIQPNLDANDWDFLSCSPPRSLAWNNISLEAWTINEQLCSPGTITVETGGHAQEQLNECIATVAGILEISDLPPNISIQNEISSADTLEFSQSLPTTDQQSYQPVPFVQTWQCSYEGCQSQQVFTRYRELQKHYRRHFQKFHCRFPGCPRSRPDLSSGLNITDSTRSGRYKNPWFSNSADRDRHERSHLPPIQCTAPGCTRTFSRLDNMKDHCRRIHQSMHLGNRNL